MVQNKIDGWKEGIEHAKTKRAEFVNSPSYGIANRLEGGAEILIECINKFLAKDCKKPRGVLEYALDRGIVNYGRVNFRSEFGGRGLSNADGIRVEEQWDTICDAVCLAADDDVEAVVTGYMDASKRVVRPLLELSKALKSQNVWRRSGKTKSSPGRVNTIYFKNY
jgi:hypothetical protein